MHEGRHDARTSGPRDTPQVTSEPTPPLPGGASTARRPASRPTCPRAPGTRHRGTRPPPEEQQDAEEGRRTPAEQRPGSAGSRAVAMRPRVLTLDEPTGDGRGAGDPGGPVGSWPERA